MLDEQILEAPSLWPQWPYLAVERRMTTRQGDPCCFLVVDSEGEVAPVVHVSSVFPPGDDFDLNYGPHFHYPDFASLRADSWKPVLKEDGLEVAG